ncbi:3-hydroxyacyl-CoA dehydrogenase [Amorphus orientalis]|uniref:3-hydroxybutyryl-CoA dehydrogenase n=1 Tax=Amorphus orientalis TaxID=649198 RepID=A0AAE3VSY7_9HYPH|nr:3-hydroxyacyl-CoA dehydrogenase [Amorphus orientalis]MDQ0317551.1 3-hydroxybutyryl-CoA dehydrogenase [Amorphus orientalis]
MRDVNDPEFTVGIVGAGVMGQGIAQVSIAGGMRAILFDAKEGAAEAGRREVFKRIDRLVEKKQLDNLVAATQKAQLSVASSLSDFSDCDTVVEAVVENLEVKRSIFTELEGIVADDAILATNTSSLPIASIARTCERPGRVAGMHFFNPVPLMRLVEIIEGPATTEAVADTLAALGDRMGRTAVKVKDSPGFLVNLGGRAYYTEALRMLDEGVATPSQIDAILTDCCGFRMGPFALMDLTGMDVNYPVSMIVYEGFLNDRRLATTPRHKLLYEAGRLGRKTRAGHFDYDEAGKPISTGDADYEPHGMPAQAVFLAEPSEALAGFCKEVGLSTMGADDGIEPILGYPVGEDATSYAVRLGIDPKRLVCVDLSANTAKRVTLMTAPGADPGMLDAVAGALRDAGRVITAIKDSPGFVALRMRAMIANLGTSVAEAGLAEPADIDTALKLGLNYPMGPLEMAEDLGLKTTLSVMERLQAITGDDRYRPTLWLRRRAMLDLPIRTPS